MIWGIRIFTCEADLKIIGASNIGKAKQSLGLVHNNQGILALYFFAILVIGDVEITIYMGLIVNVFSTETTNVVCVRVVGRQETTIIIMVPVGCFSWRVLDNNRLSYRYTFLLISSLLVLNKKSEFYRELQPLANYRTTMYRKRKRNNGKSYIMTYS